MFYSKLLLFHTNTLSVVGANNLLGG